MPTAAMLLREHRPMIANDFDIRDCLVSAVLLPDPEATRRTSGDQGGQLFQATMDVDLDECGGLAGCAGCSGDAETPQLHETDHAGLRRLQPAKQIVQRGGAYRGLAMILDCD